MVSSPPDVDPNAFKKYVLVVNLAEDIEETNEYHMMDVLSIDEEDFHCGNSWGTVDTMMDFSKKSSRIFALYKIQVLIVVV